MCLLKLLLRIAFILSSVLSLTDSIIKLACTITITTDSGFICAFTR
jgi:hypothetical protein